MSLGRLGPRKDGFFWSRVIFNEQFCHVGIICIQVMFDSEDTKTWK